MRSREEHGCIILTHEKLLTVLTENSLCILNLSRMLTFLPRPPPPTVRNVSAVEEPWQLCAWHYGGAWCRLTWSSQQLMEGIAALSLQARGLGAERCRTAWPPLPPRSFLLPVTQDEHPLTRWSQLCCAYESCGELLKCWSQAQRCWWNWFAVSPRHSDFINSSGIIMCSCD